MQEQARTKKGIRTHGHACPNPDCPYFGVIDKQVHVLVGNGKRGKYGHIQTFRCQRCQTTFSSRRNTPLYYLKTHPDRIEMCLWLLAEGVDVSVLCPWQFALANCFKKPLSGFSFTGHVDATLTRWLTRAGTHSDHLHNLLFVQLNLTYLQVDELHAPVAGNRRKSWLWVAIEPVTKIIPPTSTPSPLMSETGWPDAGS
jgi:transposase-like protein